MEISENNLMTIGVDFDNTVINYNRLIYKQARDLNLIPNDTPLKKKTIRDHIRKKPDGEAAWQKIQAAVYGCCIHQAELINGVLGFFQTCLKKRITIYIVSHKTQFARRAPRGPNLIQNAMTWMTDKGFFSLYKSGFSKENVFFEPTRSAKIERIRALGCTHFIDDLEETFAESTFPDHCEKILYSSPPSSMTNSYLIHMKNWQEIYHYFFDLN
jgi:hypothetical protein